MAIYIIVTSISRKGDTRKDGSFTPTRDLKRLIYNSDKNMGLFMKCFAEVSGNPAENVTFSSLLVTRPKEMNTVIMVCILHKKVKLS